MEHTWIGKISANGRRQSGLFEISLWNNHQEVLNNHPRTKNQVEGWHNKINRRANAHHLALWSFIEFIREEQGAVECTIERLQAGGTIQRRNLHRINYEENLKTVVESYDRSRIIVYLKGVAANLNL